MGARGAGDPEPGLAVGGRMRRWPSTPAIGYPPRWSSTPSPTRRAACRRSGSFLRGVLACRVPGIHLRAAVRRPTWLRRQRRAPRRQPAGRHAVGDVLLRVLVRLHLGVVFLRCPVSLLLVLAFSRIPRCEPQLLAAGPPVWLRLSVTSRSDSRVARHEVIRRACAGRRLPVLSTAEVPHALRVLTACHTTRGEVDATPV